MFSSCCTHTHPCKQNPRVHSDLPTTFNSILPPGEYVACTEEANLICFVVSHSERERLRQVTRGQLSGVVVWRAATRCAVEGDWDLGRRGWVWGVRSGGVGGLFSLKQMCKSSNIEFKRMVLLRQKWTINKEVFDKRKNLSKLIVKTV